MEYFLASAVNEIKKMYDNRNIEIILSCTKECKSIILDIRRTSTILFNLVSNSVVHGGNKEKSIIISASIKGNNFVLSVRDNGKGISKSERENLFSTYKNKLSSKKLKETGGGLFTSGTGLSVSKKAAVEMGGTLRYIPSSSGSLFELSIPQDIQPSDLQSTLDYAIGKSEAQMFEL